MYSKLLHNQVPFGFRSRQSCPAKHYGCALPSEPLLSLTTRCLESSCDMMKWLTSSSDQYDRWLARLASSDMSKAPLSTPSVRSIFQGGRWTYSWML
jgi:hypothetical protein